MICIFFLMLLIPAVCFGSPFDGVPPFCHWDYPFQCNSAYYSSELFSINSSYEIVSDSRYMSNAVNAYCTVSTTSMSQAEFDAYGSMYINWMDQNANAPCSVTGYARPMGSVVTRLLNNRSLPPGPTNPYYYNIVGSFGSVVCNRYVAMDAITNNGTPAELDAMWFNTAYVNNQGSVSWSATYPQSLTLYRYLISGGQLINYTELETIAYQSINIPFYVLDKTDLNYFYAVYGVPSGFPACKQNFGVNPFHIVDTSTTCKPSLGVYYRGSSGDMTKWTYSTWVWNVFDSNGVLLGPVNPSSVDVSGFDSQDLPFYIDAYSASNGLNIIYRINNKNPCNNKADLAGAGLKGQGIKQNTGYIQGRGVYEKVY